MARPTSAMTEPPDAQQRTFQPWNQEQLLFAFVALELSSNQMLWVQRGNRAEYLDLLVADRVAIYAGGGLHGQKSYDLKHVILDHVADRPGVIVELPPSLDPELLCHRDLHTFNVIPVPDWFQKAIGEAKEQKIENRFFTEVVVDTKDSRLRKHRMKCGIQLLGRGKIVSKGLLDNDSRISHVVRLCERLDNTCKKTWRNRQIMCRATG